MAENDGPLVKILNPMDVDKAYELGFECVGHPDEIVKYISEEEYMEFRIPKRESSVVQLPR